MKAWIIELFWESMHPKGTFDRYFLWFQKRLFAVVAVISVVAICLGRHAIALIVTYIALIASMVFLNMVNALRNRGHNRRARKFEF